MTTETLFADSSTFMEIFGSWPGATLSGCLPGTADEILSRYHKVDGATQGCYAIATMRDSVYHNPALGFSSSQLKKILRSPAHFKAAMKKQDTDTPARAFGRAVHALTLEPYRFEEGFSVWNAARRGALYKSFVEEHAGKTILPEDDFERARDRAAAILADESMGAQFRHVLHGVKTGDTWEVVPSEVEYSIFWTDEETGLKLKIRADAIRKTDNGSLVFDVKTTDDVRYEHFQRQALDLGYDLSAAMYMEGARRFFGGKSSFLFVAAESSDPYCVRAFPADDDFVEEGQKKFDYARRALAWCRENDTYPGYPKSDSMPPLRALPWMEFDPRKQALSAHLNAYK